MALEVTFAILIGLSAYLAIGAIVYCFLLLGAFARLDPAAAEAPLRVRLLIAPGLIALWPVVVLRLCWARPPQNLS
jgi:hypothetical protein